MAALFYFYKRQKKIYLNTEKTFLRAYLVTFSCIVLDIFSIIALDYRFRLPELFVKFICKSYLVSLLGVAFCGLLYVCVDIYTKKKEYREKVKKYKLAALAGICAIYALPLYYRFAADGVTVIYTYGSSVMATYIFAVGFLMVNFSLMRKEKRKINPARREAVRLWMIIWLGSSLIQFFAKDLLIVGYMSAIGMMMLYLKLENPETNLDRESGLFNHNALMQYTRQLFGREQRFSVLALMLKKPLRGRIHSDLNFLSNVPEAFVFKDMENEILLVFEKPDTAEKTVQRISQYFPPALGDMVYMPDSEVINNAEDLFYLIQTIYQNICQGGNAFSESRLILIDRTKVEEMYQEKEIEKLLEYAIKNDRIEVFYQPIFSTKEERFTCAEALVRIRDENGKIIPPGIFIEVAERNGAILELGKMVFEKVCRMIQERNIEQIGLHYLEINLSVMQCAYEQLAEEYVHIMEKYKVCASQVNLEITESASLNAKMVLLNNMKKLIARGVRFSLDDFGTGQSNLNYIVDMPVDIVKFDRDMTMAYFENPKAKYVMDNAINMIHGMELEIVSEGIETKEQYQTMKELGISYIQGYYFSKPLAEEEFCGFIRERNIQKS